MLANGYAVLPGSVVKDANKAPYSGVYTEAAEFWAQDLPTAPADVLAALDKPKYPARVPGLLGLPSVPHVLHMAPGRGEAFVVRLVEYWARRIAPMPPDSGRRGTLYAASRSAGEYLHHAPHIEAWVLAELEAAAHACQLIQTDGERSALANIENGLRDGQANPLDLPERSDWKPTARAAIDGNASGGEFEVEQVRARAWSLLGDVFGMVARLADDDGHGVHPAARFSVEYAIAALLQAHVESGQASVTIGTVRHGLIAGRGSDAMRNAGEWIKRAGWTVEPGGTDDDGTPRGTRYTMPEAGGVEKRQGAENSFSDVGGAEQKPYASCRFRVQRFAAGRALTDGNPRRGRPYRQWERQRQRF